MSCSPEFVEFTGQKPAGARLPEKSSFTQTCSLLSQYLKEKGSFGDLSLGMACNTEGNGNGNGAPEMLRPTMNLFPMTEKPADVCSRNMETPRIFRSMDLFPQQAGFGPSVSKEDVQKRIEPCVNKLGAAETQTGQMTIFYAGQVIVFDDFPADKAKEVMLLASKGNSQNYTTFPPVPAKSHPGFAPNVAKMPIESSGSIPSSSNAIPNFGNNLIQECMQAPPQPVARDLPIARRASLHRFLEKRKDRINSRTPYQTSSPPAAPSKPAKSKSWLRLDAQFPK